jgi:hypothetical protein
MKMFDDIDALVEASLNRERDAHGSIEMCPNCKIVPFHGLPNGGCPGSHLVITGEQLAAIESQAAVDMADYWGDY